MTDCLVELKQLLLPSFYESDSGLYRQYLDIVRYALVDGVGLRGATCDACLVSKRSQSGVCSGGVGGCDGLSRAVGLAIESKVGDEYVAGRIKRALGSARCAGGQGNGSMEVEVLPGSVQSGKDSLDCEGRGFVADIAQSLSDVEAEGLSGEVDELKGLTGAARRKKKRALRAGVGGAISVDVDKVDAGATCVDSIDKKEKKEKKSGALQRKERKNIAVATSVGSNDNVPEWRVKSAKVPQQFGVFRDCSVEVQQELRNTRAARLVAENRVATLKAEADARRYEAQLKSRMVEREVEKKRLVLEAAIKKGVEQQYGVDYASGFAQTIVSEGLSDIIHVPSLDGSISPNSSISVAEVVKMERTICSQAEKINELTLRLNKLDGTVVVDKVGEVAGNKDECKDAVDDSIDRRILEEDEPLMERFRLKQAACEAFYNNGGTYFDGVARGYEDSEPSIDELKWRMEGNMPTPKK